MYAAGTQEHSNPFFSFLFSLPPLLSRFLSRFLSLSHHSALPPTVNRNRNRHRHRPPWSIPLSSPAVARETNSYSCRPRSLGPLLPWPATVPAVLRVHSPGHCVPHPLLAPSSRPLAAATHPLEDAEEEIAVMGRLLDKSCVLGNVVDMTETRETYTQTATPPVISLVPIPSRFHPLLIRAPIVAPPCWCGGPWQPSVHTHSLHLTPSPSRPRVARCPTSWCRIPSSAAPPIYRNPMVRRHHPCSDRPYAGRQRSIGQGDEAWRVEKGMGPDDEEAWGVAEEAALGVGSWDGGVGTGATVPCCRRRR